MGALRPSSTSCGVLPLLSKGFDTINSRDIPVHTFHILAVIVCGVELTNWWTYTRLRLYGSTSSNQFPDAANGFQIPPDEHRDFDQVIFQYMKRAKLFGHFSLKKCIKIEKKTFQFLLKISFVFLDIFLYKQNISPKKV